MQSWILLVGAIISEVCGTTAMKMADGFSRVVPSIMLFVLYGISFTLLTLALKKIDVSVAYAIWSGLGTALISIIGVIYFGEEINLIKAVSIGLIIAGVVGLNLSGTAH